MCIYMNKCVCTCVSVYMCVYTATYVCMYACMHVAMYLCTSHLHPSPDPAKLFKLSEPFDALRV